MSQWRADPGEPLPSGQKSGEELEVWWGLPAGAPGPDCPQQGQEGRCGHHSPCPKEPGPQVGPCFRLPIPLQGRTPPPPVRPCRPWASTRLLGGPVALGLGQAMLGQV